MRKVIAVAILIGLGVLIWFNPSIYNSKNRGDDDDLSNTQMDKEEIIALAKEDEEGLKSKVLALQSTPEQIVDFNAKVMEAMYSGELSEEEVKLLGGVQRYYYDEELLKENPESLHLRALVEDVRRAVEEESWIVGYKISGTEYDPDDGNIATVLIAFSPNSSDPGDDIIMRYLLERRTVEIEGDGTKVEKGLWYIKGWVGANESELKITE